LDSLYDTETPVGGRKIIITLKQSEKIYSQLEAVNTSTDRDLEYNSSIVGLRNKYTNTGIFHRMRNHRREITAEQI
jgi:hypothetical protein